MEPCDDELACAPAQPGKFALVSRRILAIKELIPIDQRENLFHSRCLVNNTSLSLIVDGGSCCNIVNERVVKHFKLPTTPHPTPYGLQWISDKACDTVTQQAWVTFSIGAYVDKVLCDVIKMDATHVLLGRPWQFDRRTFHDGYLNRYMFQYNGKRVTLLPMTL